MEKTKPWHEDIREEEIPKIAEIKKRLEEDEIEVNWKIHSDHTVKRFLRARAGDVDKGYEMFTAHLRWREDNKIDTILEDGPAENENIARLKEYWPGHRHKFDNEGSPVFIEKLGPVDVKGIVLAVPEDKIIHYQMWNQENDVKINAELSAKAGKTIERVIIIEDFDGVGWSHLYTPAMSIYQQLLKMGDEQYPESLKRYYVVNPPMLFSVVYKLMSPFVDARTLAKVIVCTGSKEETTKTLLEIIDPEDLPEEYGGTCKCEGGCVPGGGPYDNFRSDGSPINPVSVDVGRRSVHELRVKIPRSRSTISWEFSVKSHDIGFAVLHEPENEEDDDDDEEKEEKEHEEVVALERYDSSVESVTGEHVVEKSGTFILRWDNSYSTLRTKSITYSVKVDHVKEKKKTKKKKNKQKKEKRSKKEKHKNGNV